MSVNHSCKGSNTPADRLTCLLPVLLSVIIIIICLFSVGCYFVSCASVCITRPHLFPHVLNQNSTTMKYSISIPNAFKGSYTECMAFVFQIQLRGLSFFHCGSNARRRLSIIFILYGFIFRTAK